MKKKILAGVIAICMAFGSAAILPENTFTESTNISASAESTATSGKCGENVNWVLENGVLTISGTGDMYNHEMFRYDCFWWREDITSVVIQSGVTSIGENAFHDCSCIESVTIPNTVTYIGECAFDGCIGLKSINLPDSVDCIGPDAFWGCKNLESVTIPSTLTKISGNAFDGTKWLENKQKENPLVVVNGVLINGSKCSGDVAIPDSVTSIAEYAFSSCENIKSVSIPNSITSISEGCFYSCNNLESVTISNSVTSIGDSAFFQCRKLKNVNIPSSVTCIGSGAFGRCDILENLDIPSTVTIIGSDAFNATKWLKNKQNEDPLVIINGILVDGRKCTGNVIIPNDLKGICDGVFNNNKDIKSVTLPNNITSICNSMFFACNNLESITIPSGVTNIGSRAFDSCTNLKSMTIPESVKTIEDLAFHHCTNLENLSIPSSVTTIGGEAFENTKWLKNKQEENPLVVVNGILIDGTTCSSEVIIPSDVKTIGNSAFQFCDNVRRVVVPDGVTSIGEDAFYSCRNLETITIPSTVTNIGITAFGYVDDHIDDNFTIYGIKGTKAEKYANQYGIQFKEGSITRLAGSNRYDTAAKISQASFEKADTVYLASGLNYADALAAVPLAADDSPILLTSKNLLSDDTLTEIWRLKAKNVIILGGEGAISKTVENKLKAEGLNTSRIAGKNRFETATMIANGIEYAPKDVFFVYYNNYADALAAGAAAAAKKAPILYLKTNGEIDADTAAYLKELKGRNCVKNAYVIGGSGVISDDMANKAAKALGLEKATRVAGKDRFETNLEVNKKFAADMYGNMVCVATGMDFPDALSGGVYAALNKAPLFLINSKTKTATLSENQTAYLKTKAAGNIVAFGGTGAVSDEYIEEIAKSSK